MIDITEVTTKPAYGQDVAAGTDVHELVDNSLSSIIGNARMIALDAAAPEGELAQRLASIIDNARKISLIVHRQIGAGHPADPHDPTDLRNQGAKGRQGRR